MRRNSTPSLGAIHPILFFMLVYGISLFLALFVCRTVYYSINNDPISESNKIISVDASSTLNATALK